MADPAHPGLANTAAPRDTAGPGLVEDATARERLARLEELLGRLEHTAGPVSELALDAVSELAAIYGEALARCLAHTSDSPTTTAAISGDELVGHLLVLHDLHPEPVDRRVARAVDQLRSPIAERGGTVELLELDAGVATVQLSAGGCASSGGQVADAVRETILAMAPELADVRCVPPPRQPAFVSADSLLRPPAPAGHGT